MVQGYDIIIAGSGLAGLTLATELVRRPCFRDKRILLLDRDTKTKNDRTWSFWATPQEDIPPVVYRTWEKARFYAPGIEVDMDMGDYRYHKVRGLDYYTWCFRQLSAHPNVERLQARILRIDAGRGVVHTDRSDFQAPFVFNSAQTAPGLMPDHHRFASPFSATGADIPGGYTRLLQHFLGWHIRTKDPAFDPGEIRFMDFRVDQDGATRFVYVLPFSETEALVEYTLFSDRLLPDQAYARGLEDYIGRFMDIGSFEVTDTEFGIIPMTDYPFNPRASGAVWNIGTAGGFVKASSGYAFKRTRRKLTAFVDRWVSEGHPDASMPLSAWRFRAYDSVLLRVLRDQPEAGQRVFAQLFTRLPAHAVLRFLDEDSTPAAELLLMSKVPRTLFMQKAFQQARILTGC
jgi:lycopene beta-cyclase